VQNACIKTKKMKKSGSGNARLSNNAQFSVPLRPLRDKKQSVVLAVTGY
jgi:hypothetical protein